MNCIKCGNQLKSDDVFCNRCGTKVKPAYGKYPNYAGIYNCAMTIFYGIAVLACFICNLAIEHTLSWFYIVLSAVALAYCITNVPVVARKHKPVIAGLCASVMLYALLFVCNWFAHGDWLFSVAYPLATVSLLFGWGILLVCVSRHMDWLIKSALISLIAGASTITINPLCDYLLGESVRIYDYLSPIYWAPAIIGNKIVFICCLAYSFVTLLLNHRLKHSEKA